MAVYVDEINNYSYIRNYATIRHGSDWCHMIADSREELDAMAVKIGLKVEWRQDSGTWGEHYDLIPRKRERAILFGAIPISCGEMGRKWSDRMDAGKAG